ncbi:Oidioi.mRNA.OKI2018_I69.PAR.g12739.t1.cds [Oikopleura dioica]|uniref:Oidioi.mRNA.OKI2018_I69.PAR.g12739.t1.cds n=1 Tax=Oikopleura dioica TaxID=34765 RepID=A0ABN7S1G8_OIKDI|nr:Oidioi.mRNA.OKI2018_I69.PAR.g12739.t1.cds [Oikopleura dioica]
MIGAKEILPIGGFDVLGSSILTKETCSETSFTIPKNYLQKWELEETNTCDDSCTAVVKNNASIPYPSEGVCFGLYFFT